MYYFTRLRLKAIDFWKRNKKKVLIFLILIFIVAIINNIIKNMPEKIPEPSTSYTPHVSVINSENSFSNDKEVPKKYQQPISNLIDKYFNYCNSGEYENAYNLITDECKKAYYPNLDSFTAYVKAIFEGKKKIYNIQSYSIVDNKYIYSIRILDDILANGTSEGYYYYEEKLVLTEINGEIKLSIGEFIEENNPQISVEDEYIKVEIIDKVVDYSTETYKVVVTNKSDDKYIVIADGTQKNEVKLNLGSLEITPENELNLFVIKPGSFRVQELSFEKFYDDQPTSQSIKFGAIRILNDYDYSVKTTEEVLNKAVKLYSLEVPLQ